MNLRAFGFVFLTLVLILAVLTVGFSAYVKTVRPSGLGLGLLRVAEAAAPQASTAPARPGSDPKWVKRLEAATDKIGESPAPTPAQPQTATAPTTLNLSGEWKFSQDENDLGVAHGWYLSDWDSNSWPAIKVPGNWEDQGYANYNGYAWYRRSVTIPAGWTNEPVRIYFGAIDDSNWVYVNGSLVGSTPEADWTTPRIYSFGADVLRPGQVNIIAVRVLDRAGEGGIIRGPVEMVYGMSVPLPEYQEPPPPESSESDEGLEEFRAQLLQAQHSRSVKLNGAGVVVFFALLGALLYSRRLQVMARALLTEPTRAAFAGVVGLLALPAALVVEVMVFALVSVVLAITIVGALAVPAVAIVYLAVLCAPVLMAWLGCLAICLALGQATLALFGRRDSSPVWGTLLGAALLSVGLTLIFEIAPVLGGLLLASLIIFGFGLALITGTGAHEGWHPRELRHWRRRFSRAEPTAPEETPPLPEEAAAPDAPPVEESPAPEGEEPPPAA